MLYNEEILQVYIDEYEQISKRKRKGLLPPKNLRERINRLYKAMKRVRPSQVTTRYLEETHRQIKNLSYFAFQHQDMTAIQKINGLVLPELLRLDLCLFLPASQEELSPDFLSHVQIKQPGAICNHPLFELYHNYKRFVIEYKIMDLVPARPELEFPETLAMNRHFILHIGPTNSGKTFQSLERLKNAECGIYLGPLRLLALEVYEKMQDCGIPCTMLTGQECIADKHSRITASTIEMADFGRFYDIAVIDEAQLTADPERGHCWTRAILGLKAKEIHLCMSPAAEKVVTHLIQLCQDDFELRRYERKTSLLCEDTSFSFPEDVQPKDAFVVFSKKAVLDVAGRLEEEGIRASVIYGSLPPEIRRRQMQLFTSGKTNVVVATDAIGMGLNLPVRRIVFIQTEKFDGQSRRGLRVPEIKQIAGRAGRFGLFDTGYVNAMGEEALAYIKERLELPEEPIHTVSLGFPQILLQLDEPLDVLLKVWRSVEPSAPFEKINIDEALILYAQAERHQHEIYGFEDKRILYKMITCPIDSKDRDVLLQWLDYCRNYPAGPSLSHPVFHSADKKGIQQYESYYRKLDLYYQFSHRFDKIIDENWLAQERARTEAKIMQLLGKGKKSYISRCQYCGKLLPVGYHFKACEQCFQSGQRRWYTAHLA